MKKRIIGVFILIVFSMTMMLNAFAFSDVEEGKTKDAIEKLTGLGILKGYEDGTFKPRENIKRSEFVAIINRALGVSELISGVTQNDVFADVPAKHWAAGDIKYASDKGLISGYGDQLFGPEDNVTYEQAFKMIFNAMGYEYIANSMGSYPDNYIMLAASKGITKGITIKFSDNATRENICYILYEAMQINLYEQTGFGGEINYQETDKTLLSELLRMKDNGFLEGIIIENEITSLNGKSNLDKGQVVLEDKDLVKHTLLVGESKANELLGMKVEVYVDKNENNAFPIINKATPKDNTLFSIESERITNVISLPDGFKIEYEDKDNIKNIVTKDLKVIYNGLAITNPVKDDLNIENGSIKFIENDKNSKYDVALIECVYSFVVDKISLGTKSIFLKDYKLNGNNRISLDNDDDSFTYTLKDDKGSNIELDGLRSGDVITVRSDRDNKNIDVVVSKKTIKGQIKEYSSENEIVKIEDKEYKLAKNEQNKIMIPIDLQKSGIYLLDAEDRIVGFTEDESLIENIGYIATKAYKPQYGADTLFVKMLRGGFAKKELDKNDDPYYVSGNKDLETYQFADKVRFNGAIKSLEYINNNMNEGDIVDYGMDKEGKINRVDLVQADFSKDDAKFNPEIAAFGGGFYLDDKTVVINVPTKKFPSDPDVVEEDYYVNVKFDIANTYSAVAGYEIHPKTKIAKFAVVKTTMRADVPGNISDDNELFIVTGRSEKIENEEAYCVLEGYEKGKAITLNVKNDSRVYTAVSNLKEGDMIFYSVNSQDLVDHVVLVESFMPRPEYFHVNKRGDNEKIFGRLLSVKRNELLEATNKQQSQFTINIAQKEEDTQIPAIATIDTKNMPVIYELNSQTGKVKMIDIDDLLAVDEAGFGKYTDASEIFICKKGAEYSGIVVVK